MSGFITNFFLKIVKLTQKTDLKEKFSDIYADNAFGGEESRSGEGSNLIQTAVIRREIPLLLQELGVKTFLDAPCGDWYWLKETPLGVLKYTGVDIVSALIEKNQQAFGNDSTNFLCLNLVEDLLPQSDLIFCRDCLVHLNYKDIGKMIANFKRSNSKYLLTTTFTDRSRNSDLVGKDIWRPLNLQIAPFNFPKPIKLINEQCTEGDGHYSDKHLGLWLLADLC